MDDKKKALIILIEADRISFPGSRLCDSVIGAGQDAADAIRTMLETGEITPCEYERVEVVVDTDRTVIFPQTAHEPGMENNYLELNNISVAPSESIVVSPSLGIRAVMVVPRALTEYLNEVWGENVGYTSPVIESIYRQQRGMLDMNLTRRFAYITLFGDKLEYADIFPWESKADLLYYLKRLENSFDLRSGIISVTGHDAADISKMLTRYYRGVLKDAHNKR